MRLSDFDTITVLEPSTDDLEFIENQHRSSFQQWMILRNVRTIEIDDTEYVDEDMMRGDR